MSTPQTSIRTEQCQPQSAAARGRQDAPPPEHTIVIVGAGFSGTAVAINLLRLAQRWPLRIVLIDQGQIARGVAYAARHYPYLLNVPAGRMSATSADPGEFLEFAQRSIPDATAEDFLPRELYGDYLESSLASAELSAPAQVRLERVRGLAIAIDRPHRNGVLQVHLADGRHVNADAVVLALGNPPPARLRGTEALLGSARYVENPWKSPPRFRADETVLIVGTGLTMADIVLAGSQAARGRARIHAISRHGLLPAPQTSFRQTHHEHDSAPLLQAASLSIRQLVRATRALSHDLALRNGDWREAVGVVRGVAPALWQRLQHSERQRFLRHVRCFWDVHRHRLPQSSWAALSKLRESGHLHIHAGRLSALQHAGDRIRVSWRARGDGNPTSLLVDRVINCTGPDYDLRRTHDRLLRSLLAQGLAVPDPLGLGLATDAHGALRGAWGRGAAGNIFYIGPMLRPEHWETTAVQELRDYAERLARHLARRHLQLNSAVVP